MPPEQRCLSPSDFGFHNAILAADGRLRFFDFEYAGWDDPAKLICDFFCQPELSVNQEHWKFFVEQLILAVSADAALRDRALLLLPAYRVKWCCIILNEFLGAGRDRRTFSMGEESAASRKSIQLNKARRLLFA